MEVARFDEPAGVESGVDRAEAQDLSFGAAGGGSAYIGGPVAQAGIEVVPQLLCGWAAREDEVGLGVDPLQSTAQLAGRADSSSGGTTPPLGSDWLRCTPVQRQRLAKPLWVSVRPM